MKTIKSLILFLLAGNTLAQIPNNGFETWTNMGAYENPEGWGTLNNTTAAASVFTATKGTPGSPGASYLKLTSKTLGTTVVNGIAVSGKLDTITMMPESGFAYTGQPVSFSGKWQHMIYGSSQGGITVVLTKWNTSLNQRDTIAIADQTLSGMAMSWANFNIPFTYFTTDAPDSCIIFLRASGAFPTNNDYLWVDNLNLVGTVTGMEEMNGAVSSFTVYPNPANTNVHLQFENKENNPVTISMRDLTGKLVYQKNIGSASGTQMHQIYTGQMAGGIYSITLQTSGEAQTLRVILE